MELGAFDVGVLEEFSPTPMAWDDLIQAQAESGPLVEEFEKVGTALTGSL